MGKKGKIIWGIVLAISAGTISANGDPAAISLKVILAILAIYLIGSGLKKQKV